MNEWAFGMAYIIDGFGTTKMTIRALPQIPTPHKRANYAEWRL